MGSVHSSLNIFGVIPTRPEDESNRMSVVPNSVDTTQQPPMTVPLRHFVVGLGLLLAGIVSGLADVFGVAPGTVRVVHIHLLLAGWVCVTIMGAMTQFVPVWSGTALHSQRLPTLQLWAVTVGIIGFATSLLGGALTWVPVFGAAMLVGFWIFVYNIGRTLLSLPAYDVTERHFGLALGFFAFVATLGFLLAVDFVAPMFSRLPVSRASVIGSHATLAVFGAVMTTVLGALYQLATMFTQTDLHGADNHLRRIEEWGYPLGVVGLAVGRLLGTAALARAGGVLMTVSLLGFSLILARRLHETQVEWTPMLSRYAVAAPAVALWAVLTLRAWIAAPLARSALLGAPGTSHLLAVGVVGSVVFGTLYHVVPFIIWVHRYSDLLGYEPVPMVDDLYSDRLAAVDFAFTTGGTVTLVASALMGLPSPSVAVGGGLFAVGALCFVANMGQVLRDHGPESLPGLLLGTFWTDRSCSSEGPADSADRR
jgi:phage shock protein PspC (stress-responsive transcriptional regulator)